MSKSGFVASFFYRAMLTARTSQPATMMETFYFPNHEKAGTNASAKIAPRRIRLKNS
jgi:hypothetical protein